MSRIQHVNPPTITAPFSRYSQGVIVKLPARWLYVSGQVGMTLSGVLPDSFEEQARNAWRNVFGLLEASEMSVANLVKVTAYLTRAGDVGQYRTVRDSMLGKVSTASTLVVVAGLPDPRLLIEIEAVAAD